MTVVSPVLWGRVHLMYLKGNMMRSATTCYGSMVIHFIGGAQPAAGDNILFFKEVCQLNLATKRFQWFYR